MNSKRTTKAGPTLQAFINHDGKKIPVEIVFSKRRTFSIQVAPHSVVKVRAPLRYDVDKLLGQVQQKAAWIVKQQEKFRDYPKRPPRRDFAEGELFTFLGRKYKLRPIQSTMPEVKLTDDGFLEVHTKNPTPAALKAILDFWYKAEALRIFSTRFPRCLKAMEPLKLPPLKKWNMKFMKGRWGCCSRDRIITMNPALIAAPIECIDYVIIHELCHLKEMNHSPRYYNLLSKALPEWKTLRARLNKSTETRFL